MSKCTVTFKAGMTCEGCSKAITKVLTKLEGVESVECLIPDQLVKVTGTADAELMLEKLKKWGDAAEKEVSLLGSEPCEV